MAAEIAELILDMGSLPENNTLDKAVDAAAVLLPQIKDSFGRKLAVSSLNEFLDSRRRGGMSEVKKQLNAIKNEARLDRKLRKRIDSLLKQINDGTAQVEPAKFRREVSATIKALKSNAALLGSINQLQESVRVLEKNVKSGGVRGKKRTKKAQTHLEERLSAKKKELARQNDLLNQIKTIRKRLSDRDFKKTSRETAEKSKEVLKLEAERNALQSQLRAEIENARELDAFSNLISGVASNSRAILTSFDLSAIGIQGALLGIANPKKVPAAIVASLKSWAKPEVALKELKKLQARQHFKLGQDAGLHLSEVDGGLLKSEEFFQGQLAKKIPGIAASERAFITYLNVLRAHSFDSLVNSGTLKGSATPDEAKAIANYVNIAGGRGNLKALDKHAEALSLALFSPRYQVSRFQYLMGAPVMQGLFEKTPETSHMNRGQRFLHNYNKSKKARLLVAGEMAKVALAMQVVASLWMLAGFEVEDDPTSSDFGKLKDGHTRVDLSGGLRSPYVFMRRALSQEVKSLKQGSKPRDFTFRDLSTFGRGKLSPASGFVVDMITQETFTGEEVTVGNTLSNNFLPISVQDIIEESGNDNISRTAILTALSLIGVNAKNFNPNIKKPRKPRKR